MLEIENKQINIKNSARLKNKKLAIFSVWKDIHRAEKMPVWAETWPHHCCKCSHGLQKFSHRDQGGVMKAMKQEPKRCLAG